MYNFIFVYICNIYLRFVFVFVNMRVYVCFASLINKYRFTLLYFTLCYLCMFALALSLSIFLALFIAKYVCMYILFWEVKTLYVYGFSAQCLSL